MPDASAYYSLLRPFSAKVDLWRTTYFHPLPGGARAVVEWFKGSGLRPFLEPLGGDERAAYLDRYTAEIAKIYPPAADGSVLLPFPRVFLAAIRQPRPMLAPMESLNSVPAELRGFVERWWERACGREGFLEQYGAPSALHREQLPRVVAASEFVAQALIQDPLTVGWTAMDVDAAELAGAQYERRSAATASAEETLALLREWRRRVMARIAWRDIAGTASVSETLLAVSDLVDASILAAVSAAALRNDRWRRCGNFSG